MKSNFSFNYRETNYSNGVLVGQNSDFVLVNFFYGSKSNGYNFYLWVKKSYLVTTKGETVVNPVKGDFVLRSFDTQVMTTDEAVLKINRYFGTEVVNIQS